MNRDMPMSERFAFGENWRRFLGDLSDERIDEAQWSLVDMLGDGRQFEGRHFFDIGCGSGLFSLAARNLGAEVVSIDFDPESVECARYLKEKYHPGDEKWRIMRGSVLDREFMAQCGQADIVYSWGVLHHTGSMWEAMANALDAVADRGLVHLAIYNDQGGYSDRWKTIKRWYVGMPKWARPLLCTAVLVVREAKPTLGQLLRLRNPWNYWMSKKQERGMSFWTNVADWVGGYPFEVAKPEEVFDFCRARGFVLLRLRTNRGEAGCNEFVLRKGGVV
ncbi:Methyltransferase type 12 [Pseudodesulfovibrio aespoeensis Aspo-2]|uniref:Methyltransferase type 12 n=3 Tax=Pseudodesulfovibrio TaxID=2035811 RepID=E6VZL7_PSEA9|nr:MULTISPECIES: class I SAM-dependent methyltransferase [Pseudodesulfovibrio]ADU61731.1 Methyltransferase type 12 [Pseudodesulfovibrio aespoeensis Aspo-2]